MYSFIQTAHLSISDAHCSFDEYFELNVCYYRYYMKLPMLGEGDYGTFGSILPLSCLTAGAGVRLGLCLSIQLQRSGYHMHAHTCARTPAYAHTQLPTSVTHSCRDGCDYSHRYSRSYKRGTPPPTVPPNTQSYTRTHTHLRGEWWKPSGGLFESSPVSWSLLQSFQLKQLFLMYGQIS